MKPTDVLNAGNGGLRWNIFVVALLVGGWFLGEYISVSRFETHVDEALATVTKDVDELKGEIKNLRDYAREDTQNINERIDKLIRANGRGD